MKYYAGYKYQLAEDLIVQTEIKGFTVTERFFVLSDTGELLIRAGYAWDGPSGIAIDTKTFMRGSMVHDVFFQAMREGYLPQKCFTPANKELRRICLEDGMWSVRAWWVFRCVERFGSAFAAVQPEKIFTAP